MALSRLNRVVVLLTVGILFLTPLLRFTTLMFSQPPNFFDFGVYYQVGQFVVEGQPLYDTPLDRIPNTANAWLYPPIVAVIFVPFQLLPFEISAWVWVTISLLALLFSVRFFLRASIPNCPRYLLWAVLLAVLLYYPTYSLVYLGQVTGFFVTALFLVAGLIFRPHDHNDRFHGILVTLPAVVKPFYAPAGVTLLRDRRRIYTALGTGIILAIFSVLVFGIGENIRYLKVLDGGGKEWGIFKPVTTWNRHTYAPFYSLGFGALIAKVSVVLTTIIATLVTRQRDEVVTESLIFALGVTAIALAAPSPDLLLLMTVLPAMLVVGVIEYRAANGQLGVPVGILLLVHLHPVGLRLLMSGPVMRVIDNGLLFAAIPFLQPALLGILLLFVWILFRLYRPPTISH